MTQYNGPPHISVSQFGSWVSCGRQYELERLVRVPQSPANWFVVGHAWHAATEAYDLSLYIDNPMTSEEFLQHYLSTFEEEVEKEREKEPDLAKWRKGGRASKDKPDKETLDWYREQAPDWVNKHIAWWDEKQYTLFELPDDSPAIEFPFHLEIGGVLVKGAIDRIVVSHDGMLGVVDYKTGSSTPDSNLQLGVYALAIEKALGTRPSWGAYFKARTGKLTTPAPLDSFSEEKVGPWFRNFVKARELGLFIPHISSRCTACGVRDFCDAADGPRASEVRR